MKDDTRCYGEGSPPSGMKAAGLSQEAANLIEVLTQKLDTQDGSLLCTLVACHVAEAVSFARNSDCKDDAAVKAVEDRLDHAYRVWREYENLRRAVMAQPAKGQA
jgi:hypothetical protein